jgi:glycosyltransferase involved in cell wall biosynthesis
MSATPTSVVIPCYNGERYLDEAIASVRAQTAGPVEIIVVDDGSTDGSGGIAKAAGVRYVRQDNAGVAAALNHGLRIASGPLIAFLSADDIWKPHKLALQRAALGAAENRLAFGHMLHFISPELSPDIAAGLVAPSDPMPAFSAGTLLARLDVFRTVGFFNESFAVGEFLDWFGRAKDAGLDIIMLPDVVSMRRVHRSNHSTGALKTRSYAPVLKALLDRRRAERGGQ